MLIKHLVNRAARQIHLQEKSAYTWWKVRESGVALRAPLTSDERNYLLGLLPVLQGEDLVFYDIGANIGKLSSCVAKVASVKKVYAFEPIPDVYNQLYDRLADNPFVKCFNTSLGSANSELEIQVNQFSPSSSFRKLLPHHTQEFPWTKDVHPLKVQVARLDDFIEKHRLEPPDIIKIDVQGYEDQVLAGGIQSISNAQYCIVEVSFIPLFEGGPLFDDIYQEMRRLNFRLVGYAGDIHGISGQAVQMDAIFKSER